MDYFKYLFVISFCLVVFLTLSVAQASPWTSSTGEDDIYL